MHNARLALSVLLAIGAATGTYVTLAPEGFGALALVPAFFVALVAAALFAPRLS